MRDGTFGTTGRCPPFEEELVEALESHRFDRSGAAMAQPDLDFASLDRCRPPSTEPERPGSPARPWPRTWTCSRSSARDPDIRRLAPTGATSPASGKPARCPITARSRPQPMPTSSARCSASDARWAMPDDWFARKRPSTAPTATSTPCRPHRPGPHLDLRSQPSGLAGDPEHWQGVTRQVEDKLSDALHERLTHRFVDRRTSVLMRRLRENAMLEAEITAAGDVLVEGQHVGLLHGFRFTPDPQADGEAQGTLNAAAIKGAGGRDRRPRRARRRRRRRAFVLSNDGTSSAGSASPVAKLTAATRSSSPACASWPTSISRGPLATGPGRLNLWIEGQHIKKLLGPCCA
jgi:ATP-dependent RNA helicase SUPV3L1/SUV3